jgi:hypothetical protein
MTAPENDLEVLFPDREIEIAGEPLTVREFRYREGLEMLAQARPFVAALRALLTGPEEDLAPEAFDALLADHLDAWLLMVARSCGRDVAWVARLPDKDAMTLQNAFWEVNAPFFMRRLLWGAAFAGAARARRSRSRKSSPSSSGPDSDATRTTSARA